MSRLIKKRYVSLILKVTFILFFSNTLYAQSSGKIIQLDYKNNLLTLTTENADLKNILIRLSDYENQDELLKRFEKIKAQVESSSV